MTGFEMPFRRGQTASGLHARVPHTFCALAFCAALGFSFALATTPETASRETGARAAAVANRDLANRLRFTNPYLLVGSTDPLVALASDPAFPGGGNLPDDPDGFDLGDAVASNGLVRYINVTGGYLPYNFLLEPIFGTDRTSMPTLPSLTPAGRLTYTPDASIGPFLRFKLTASDFLGTDSRSGIFKINLFPHAPAFCSAQSQLPFGQEGVSYHTQLATLGGVGQVRYGLLGAPVTPGNAGAALESAGLSLSPDGTLFGQPLFTGNLNMTVHATDAAGNAALSRGGGSPDQPLTLASETNQVVTSEVVASSCRLKINGNGKDSFSWAGVVDLKTDTLSTLAGQSCTFRVGGATFTGNFDSRGRINAPADKKGKFSLVFTPPSSMKIALGNVDLSQALGSQTPSDGQNANLILGWEFPSFRTCEVLTMQVKDRKGVKNMAFQLMGSKQGSLPAGAFLVLSVQGQDGKFNGDSGDSWVIRFLGVPRTLEGKPSDILKSATSVTVNVGDYSQTMDTALATARVLFAAPGKFQDPGVYKFFLDPTRFLHNLQMNVLSASDSSIPIALESTAPTCFPLGMSLANFTGAANRVIVPNGKTWQQR